MVYSRCGMALPFDFHPVELTMSPNSTRWNGRCNRSRKLSRYCQIYYTTGVNSDNGQKVHYYFYRASYKPLFSATNCTPCFFTELPMASYQPPFFHLQRSDGKLNHRFLPRCGKNKYVLPRYPYRRHRHTANK